MWGGGVVCRGECVSGRGECMSSEERGGGRERGPRGMWDMCKEHSLT